MSYTLLETDRLLIRPFEPADLESIHRILTRLFGDEGRPAEAALRERRSWLEWTRLSHQWLPRMHQPPYGDRAVIRKADATLIGAVGYVPVLAPFSQIPALRGSSPVHSLHTPEVGLFWAIDLPFQRQGYATEAGRPLIDYAFTRLNLAQIVATTEHTNLASQGVMRRLGMTLHANPRPTPPWLQVVGRLENPALPRSV